MVGSSSDRGPSGDGSGDWFHVLFDGRVMPCAYGGSDRCPIRGAFRRHYRGWDEASAAAERFADALGPMEGIPSISELADAPDPVSLLRGYVEAEALRSYRSWAYALLGRDTGDGLPFELTREDALDAQSAYGSLYDSLYGEGSYARFGPLLRSGGEELMADLSGPDAMVAADALRMLRVRHGVDMADASRVDRSRFLRALTRGITGVDYDESDGVVDDGLLAAWGAYLHDAAESKVAAAEDDGVDLPDAEAAASCPPDRDPVTGRIPSPHEVAMGYLRDEEPRLTPERLASVLPCLGGTLPKGYGEFGTYSFLPTSDRHVVKKFGQFAMDIGSGTPVEYDPDAQARSLMAHYLYHRGGQRDNARFGAFIDEAVMPTGPLYHLLGEYERITCPEAMRAD